MLSSDIPLDLNFKKENICKILRKEQLIGLDVEGQILEGLGRHDQIAGFQGRHEDDLLP